MSEDSIPSDLVIPFTEEHNSDDKYRNMDSNRLVFDLDEIVYFNLDNDMDEKPITCVFNHQNCRYGLRAHRNMTFKLLLKSIFILESHDFPFIWISFY